MTNKISTKDWRNLPIDRWNVTSIHQYLIDETKRKYNAEYTPGGRGSLSQRWQAEKGMIKRDITKHGPEVVRRFIEICWREYWTPDSKKYPFPTYGFMKGYQDRYWNEALQEINEEESRQEVAEDTSADNVDDDWF